MGCIYATSKKIVKKVIKKVVLDVFIITEMISSFGNAITFFIFKYLSFTSTKRIIKESELLKGIIIKFWYPSLETL